MGQETRTNRIPGDFTPPVVAFGRHGGDRLWVLGMLQRTLISGRETDGRLAMIDARCEQWQGTPPHRHHAEDETFFIYEGMFEFLVGSDTVVAGPGSFVHVPMGVIHCYRAVGEGTNRLTVTLSPAGFEEFFAEIGDPVIPGFPIPEISPERIERMMAVAPRYNLEFVSPPQEDE